VAVTSTELEVYLEDGTRSFSFIAQGTMGFRIVGDNLVQIGAEPPIVVPRTHAARNIGNGTYNEILFESKTACVGGTNTAIHPGISTATAAEGAAATATVGQQQGKDL
jgi:hypothetical protein